MNDLPVPDAFGDGPPRAAVSPTSELWLAYYATAERDAAARFKQRTNHLASARIALRLVFLSVVGVLAMTAVCYRLLG